MAVPALIGYGLDTWLGTRVVFVAVGAVLGLILGMLHLIRLAGGKSATNGKKPSKH